MQEQVGIRQKMSVQWRWGSWQGRGRQRTQHSHQEDWTRIAHLLERGQNPERGVDGKEKLESVQCQYKSQRFFKKKTGKII